VLAAVVALGLLSTVGALTTFSKDRVVFYREASSGVRVCVCVCGEWPTHRPWAPANLLACIMHRHEGLTPGLVGQQGQAGLPCPGFFLKHLHPSGICPVNCCGHMGAHARVCFLTGLNRFAHFLALDTFGHCGTVLRSAVYFVMYYSFAAPR
jgi:hypothetical protein